MNKRRYRTTDVKKANWTRIAEYADKGRVVFGVDVAKEDFVGALMNGNLSVLETLRWQHPQETPALLDALLKHLEPGALEMAMEPSGSYGDSLCVAFVRAGIPIFRVSPKRVHDAAEVYDGVPSLHDAKAAYLIGRFHLDGGSTPWVELPAWRRELKAAVSRMDFYRDQYQRGVNRLEALLARHWPEAGRLLEVGSVTMMTLLTTYGDPAEVAATRAKAAQLMRHIGGPRLREEKIKQVLAAADTTLGVECTEGERAYLKMLAEETLRSYRALREAQKAVERQACADPTLNRLAPVIGTITSAVLTATQGSPLDYANAGSYVKSLGLNLKERSSGKHKGQLRITKRGPGVARQYLYFAALRLCNRDPITQLWYQRKVRRDGGRKGKAIVAIMRKLAKSLWYVARGEAFEPQRLFNIRALKAV